MEVLDSRRLTGANLQSPVPSAVAEVSFLAEEQPAVVLAEWEAALGRILPHFDLGDSQPFQRIYEGGACIGFPAPIDKLYAATEINEWAIQAANAAMGNRNEPPLTAAIEDISRSLAQEENAPILALQKAAEERNCPFLWDDDEVSVGYGAHAQVWDARDLPHPKDVDWNRAAAIPVAMITGTNGKTTTSRMLSRILKASGLSVGSTSTDGVCVNEEMVEQGDWTGTGAARMVLRRPDVTAAVLETARGGLLRRGLAVERCDVAVLTNVAADHLGDYGINDVPAMAEVKNLICAAVDQQGSRVINADDPHLASLLEAHHSPLVLYSIREDNPLIAKHCQQGGEAWCLVDGDLICRRGNEEERLMSGSEIPCAFGGAARHNLSNALAASAAASALGISHEQIAQALSRFGAKPEDNPGRCQLVEIDGVQLMLDFGHNPHGLEAILKLAQSLINQGGKGRLCVSLGQAGDRGDDEIRSLGTTLATMAPDLVILREMVGYERGRSYREVPALIAQSLGDHGFAADQILTRDSEVEALEAAMSWAKPGDLVMLLVHLQRQTVGQWLQDKRG